MYKRMYSSNVVRISPRCDNNNLKRKKFERREITLIETRTPSCEDIFVAVVRK